jgi:hypothetical protein
MLVITPPIRLESTIYNTKGVHARHYTTDTTGIHDLQH